MHAYYITSATCCKFICYMLQFLTEGGKLREEKESDLISILVKETQNAQKEPRPFLNVRIIDGAAVVHMLPPPNVTTFSDYAKGVFFSHILKLLKFILM